MTEDLSRRGFLERAGKLVGGVILAPILSPLGVPIRTSPSAASEINSAPDTPKGREILAPAGLEFSVGINGVPNKGLTKEIRVPLNRAAFDTPSMPRNRLERSTSPLYWQEKEIKSLHNN